MKIITWNMDYWKRKTEQRELAWNYLWDTIDPDVALIQEIVPPDTIYDKHHVLYHEIDGKRKWGTALISKYPVHHEIYVNNSYLGASGLIIAELRLPDDSLLTAINVYGQLDPSGYASTTMHHILSDLTTILDKQGNRKSFSVVTLMYQNSLTHNTKGNLLLTNLSSTDLRTLD